MMPPATAAVMVVVVVVVAVMVVVVMVVVVAVSHASLATPTRATPASRARADTAAASTTLTCTMPHQRARVPLPASSRRGRPTTPGPTTTTPPPVLLVDVAQIVGLELQFDLVDLGVHVVDFALHARQLLSDTHRGHGEPPWSRSVCGEKKTGVVGVVSFVDGATGQTVGPTGGQNAARDV
jgi:hypothetical protein